MFHFPSFPPHTLYIQVRVTALDRQRGFPIRTSSDQHPVIDSPRLIADSHVLHRLLVPRHPPCALHNLATQMITTNTQQENHTRHHQQPASKDQPLTTSGNQLIAKLDLTPQHTPPRREEAHHGERPKMLASTIQFSNNNPHHHHNPPHPQHDCCRYSGWAMTMARHQPEAHCLKTQQCALPSHPTNTPQTGSWPGSVIFAFHP